MTLGEWCDIAWSALLSDTPMLANPAEFHTMMYKAFWLGEMPKGKPGQKSNRGKPSGAPPPNAAVAAFEEERRRIMALQAEAAK